MKTQLSSNFKLATETEQSLTVLYFLTDLHTNSSNDFHCLLCSCNFVCFLQELDRSDKLTVKKMFSLIF